MGLSLQLGILAGVVEGFGFWLYFRGVLKGTSRPNTATWILWLFLTALNASSYVTMSGDPAKYVVTVVSAASTLVIFVVALSGRRFEWLDMFERVVLAGGVVAALAWWWYKSATIGNLILQIFIAISFAPTYRKVWQAPHKEKALPWYVWTLAYSLMCTVVLIRWDKWQDMVYPTVCAVLHFGVGVVAKGRTSIKHEGGYPIGRWVDIVLMRD